jgi:hypothetical protein
MEERMSAQDAGKKIQKPSQEKPQEAAADDLEMAQETEAVTEAEMEVQPKSKPRPEPAKGTVAEAKHAEKKPAVAGQGESKPKSLSERMRFDQRAGRRGR